VFVNGKLAFDQNEESGLTVDQWEFTLPLVKGKNQLLIRLGEAGQGDWGFSFRLPDSVVRNRKNRYKIIR
jgi:hypothetical protein